MSLAVFSCTIPIFDFGPGGLELASLIFQLERKRRAGGRIFFRPAKSAPVSYTHLTLPTT